MDKTNKTEISLDKLKQLKKKYKISVNGSKKDIAQGLWRIRQVTISNEDLQLIFHLLEKDQQKIVQKVINNRIKKPITNYKGMWEPLPKPIKSMTRDELIKKLQKFRNVWEIITTRNQDLDDDRLNNETTIELRKLIKFYYSDDAKLLAEEYLRK